MTVPPSASATAGTVATAPSSGSQASRIETVAEADGLKLVAAFDRLEVDPGGTVTVDLSIQNTRATDVVFDEPCNDQAMTVELPAPVEPVGRDWDGIAAAFKTFALEQWISDGVVRPNATAHGREGAAMSCGKRYGHNRPPGDDHPRGRHL